MEGGLVAPVMDVEQAYARFRFCKVLRESGREMRAWELSQTLGSEHRRGWSTAVINAELELMAAVGFPISAVSPACPHELQRWRWVEPEGDPHWQAVGLFWGELVRRASRGWRRRQVEPVAAVLSVLSGQMVKEEVGT